MWRGLEGHLLEPGVQLLESGGHCEEDEEASGDHQGESVGCQEKSVEGQRKKPWEELWAS